MTILVTGAAGFIGAAVSRALCARGELVVGIDDFTSYYPVQLKHDRVADVVAGAGGAFYLRRGGFCRRVRVEIGT